MHRAGPHRFAGFPGRGENSRRTFRAVFDKAHGDPAGFTHNRQRHLDVAEPYGAPALARDQAAAHLTRDAALALADDVINRRRDGRDQARLFALRNDRVKAVGKFLGDKSGRQPAGAPAWIVHDRRQERNVVANAVDVERIERPRLRVDRGRSRRRVGDKLRDQRIVVDRNLAALIDAGVVADRDVVRAGLGRRSITREAADRRQKVAIRVLRVDPAFDGPAGKLDIALRDAQGLARRDADHLLDEIDAGDQLGHRMLDLQPCIHLQEKEALILTRHELDRAG